MAAIMETPYGDVVTCRWKSGNVLIAVNGGAKTTAFALATESGLALQALPNGQWVIVYQDSSGNVQRKYSADRGTTWT